MNFQKLQIKKRLRYQISKQYIKMVQKQVTRFMKQDKNLEIEPSRYGHMISDKGGISVA